ncbi:hypothetical protein BJG92_03457 [Arthrobacter sp. SO5]|nr:hypothetical protein [Arthrobacter sp. SO5]
MCTRKNTPKAPDLRKHCARGGTRTGFQQLNFRRSPENIANPARFVTGTARSEAQGVHIVHTLIFALSGAPVTFFVARSCCRMWVCWPAGPGMIAAPSHQ